MAILRKSLLGLVAVCIANGSAFAQDDPTELMKAAFRLVMTNKKEEAKQKLEQVIKLDPSREDAFKLWSTIEKDIWHELLLTQGEIGKITEHIMKLAQAGRKEMSRDEAKIAELVEKATQKDYGVRVAAVTELKTNHGEFAVPALVAKLSNQDDDMGSAYAIAACRELGTVVTLPLIEAAQSKNATLRQNVAAVINLLRDFRAIPAMTALAKDENAAVVTVAKAALKSMNASESADPVSLFLQQSREFLLGIGTQGTDLSEVVWSWDDGKLTFKDCDPAVYTFELAKKSAEKALALDPASDVAPTLIARSYLAQCAAIDNNNIESLSGVKSSLQMVAMAMGPKVLSRALDESIQNNQPFVAVAAIDALGKTLDRDSIGNSALMAALDNSNRMIQYAAALAITDASRANNVPNSDRVVAVLANAVGEKSLKRVTSVGFTAEAQNSQIVPASSSRKGIAVSAGYNTVRDVVEQILVGTVKPDVVVINSTLSDGIPADIIGILQENDRTKNIKFILVAGDVDKATEVYGDKVAAVIPASFKGEELLAKVDEIVKDIDESASAVAVKASQALHTLASNRVNIGGALDSIAAQLTRDDAVAIPAAEALGEGGMRVDPLIAQLTGDGSLELKKACAVAAGKILGRVGNLTDPQFQAMKAVAIDASADAGLRTAVTTALGKATLLPAQRAELVKVLSTAAVSGD